MSQYCDVCMEHAEYMCECGTAFYCGKECQIDSWENAHQYNHDVDMLMVEGKSKRGKMHTAALGVKPTPQLLHVTRDLFKAAKDEFNIEGKIFFLDGRQTIHWLGNPEDSQKMKDAMKGIKDAPLNSKGGVPIIHINFKDNYAYINEGNHRTMAMTTHNHRWIPYRIEVYNNKNILSAKAKKKQADYKKNYNKLPKLVMNHKITQTWVGVRDATREDLEAFGINVLDFDKEYAPDEYKFDTDKD